MLNRRLPFAIALGILSVIVVSAASAQETATGHVTVTATAKRGAPPPVPQSSITVSVNRKNAEDFSWVPLRGHPLQLAILIDNGSRASLSLQLNDLRNFMLSLPPNVQIAVGYMQNGLANLLQPFTSDHAAVTNSLRLPSGIAGINGSPYFCIQDLVKRWGPATPGLRREVLMITDGEDRYSGRGFNPENPYVQAATNDAQKAGVVIYSIFYIGRGRLDRRGYEQFSGQNYLIQISGDTGGEAYYQGFGDPVSFQPFLNDLRVKLENQYDLSVVAPPRKGLQNLKVKTSMPGVSVEAPKLFQLLNQPYQ